MRSMIRAGRRAQLVTEPADGRPSTRPDRTIDRLLALAAALEGATGLVLMTFPVTFVGLLIGAELSAAGATLGRITGFALFALGVACWPGARGTSNAAAQVRAMMTYGLLAAVYLFLLGLGGDLVGVLLWPAVAVHAAFTFFLTRAWVRRSS